MKCHQVRVTSINFIKDENIHILPAENQIDPVTRHPIKEQFKIDPDLLRIKIETGRSKSIYDNDFHQGLHSTYDIYSEIDLGFKKRRTQDGK
jgi:hypothetical protein